MKVYFILLILLTASIAVCTTYQVNILIPDNPATNQYNTIGEAIAAANNGDEIVIHPGDYMETLSISESLIIRGISSLSTRIVTNNQTGINISGGSVTIMNLTFICQGDIGVKLSNNCPPAIIRNCIFQNCSSGINVYTNTNYVVYNCIFKSNTNGLYNQTGTGGHPYGTIKNCIFHNNTRGIYFYALGTSYVYSVDILNSIFQNNTTGIDTYSGDYEGDIGYCVFWSNSTQYNGVTMGPVNYVGINPFIENVTGTPYYNYFPANNSPCIDAGNPHIDNNDVDGTRNDIGIFGGPYPWGEGKPVVLDIDLSPDTVQQGGTFNIEATGQTK